MGYGQATELSLYSWRKTRARSDLTLRDALERFGRAVDFFLHLVPALVAVMLIVVAFQMADEGRAGSRPQPAVKAIDLDR